MNGDVFLDSNILIYAFAERDARSPVAKRLLISGGQISVQVLNEFVNVSSRKLRIDWPEVLQRLAVVNQLLPDSSALTTETHRAAVRLAERYKLNFYDALIIASAIETECATVLSEDMQHGMVIDGVTIENPFLAPA